MKIYDTIGTKSYDNLIADGSTCDPITINMEVGNGTVKRGTVVYRKSTGFWAPAAASNAVSTNMLAVLDETVDTTGIPGTGKTIAETARAFRHGTFITGKVTLAADAAITDAVAVVLKTQGIVFDQMVPAPTFENSAANG